MQRAWEGLRHLTKGLGLVVVAVVFVPIALVVQLFRGKKVHLDIPEAVEATTRVREPRLPAPERVAAAIAFLARKAEVDEQPSRSDLSSLARRVLDVDLDRMALLDLDALLARIHVDRPGAPGRQRLLGMLLVLLAEHHRVGGRPGPAQRLHQKAAALLQLGLSEDAPSLLPPLPALSTSLPSID